MIIDFERLPYTRPASARPRRSTPSFMSSEQSTAFQCNNYHNKIIAGSLSTQYISRSRGSSTHPRARPGACVGWRRWRWRPASGCAATGAIQACVCCLSATCPHPPRAVWYGIRQIGLKLEMAEDERNAYHAEEPGDLAGGDLGDEVAELLPARVEAMYTWPRLMWELRR